MKIFIEGHCLTPKLMVQNKSKERTFLKIHMGNMLNHKYQEDRHANKEMTMITVVDKRQGLRLETLMAMMSL